jgi:acetoin utilization protein AcuC
MTLHIAYSDDYLNWKLGAGDGKHPTNPIRAKIATEALKYRLGEENVAVVDPAVDKQDRERLGEVHSQHHIANVLDHYRSDDWVGVSPKNGETALKMFAGTARLTEKIISGETRVAFNPQGAKHHAQYSYSEGFCVFNDMAWAALEFRRAGLNPVYIDWDVHAGNGVQNLLADTDIPTMSIHQYGIYPTHSDVWNPSRLGGGNYEHHSEDSHWYNWCLTAKSTDADLAWAMKGVVEKVMEYKPDVILLATGADGHIEDNWGMAYTDKGFIKSARTVAELANTYSQGRVLIGGAGGYRPYDTTPRVWASVVETIYRNTNKESEK